MSHLPQIIAEAGSNHNGSLERAKRLVDLAADAGASSIKFQFIFAEGLYLPRFFDGEKYSENTVFGSRKAEEMPEADWRAVWKHAEARQIAASASVFCDKGVAMLARLGAPYVKIASTDLTNHELIGQACGAFPEVIVSTGMASLGEIEATVGFVRAQFPQTRLRLMHCVSAYPCPLAEANVQRVGLLRSAFDVEVGYSDHTAGAISAGMALVQGASFFEKHFTTDRSLPGFDHAHALEGEELTTYVSTVREAAQSLAQPANRTGSLESITKLRARRGVYAAHDLAPGHELTRDDLLFVRPSTEFEGNDLSAFIGHKLATAVRQFDPLVAGGAVQRGRSNWEAARDYWGKEMHEKGMTGHRRASE